MPRFLPAFLTLTLVALLQTPVLAAVTEDLPFVRLRSLDKVTARTMTFEIPVGKTVRFGQLYIKVQACRKAPPLDPPESAAFLQIWEPTDEEKPDPSEWVFSGWMFASSPALSSMDHPIYDVWVIDCLETSGKSAEDAHGPSPEPPTPPAQEEEDNSNRPQD